MFVNQFAISLFGSTLAMATMASNNNAFTAVVSIGAVIFYMFLLYIMTWEIGAKDRVSVDIGKKEYKPFTGVILSLIANIPNYLLALVFAVGYPFMATHEWAGNLAAVVKTILVLIEGMYVGLLAVVKIDAVPLNSFWWTYFVITLPAILTCGISYFFGHKNIRFTSLLLYKDPNETNKK
jgi:hypothetical protein